MQSTTTEEPAPNPNKLRLRNFSSWASCAIWDYITALEDSGCREDLDVEPIQFAIAKYLITLKSIAEGFGDARDAGMFDRACMYWSQTLFTADRLREKVAEKMNDMDDWEIRQLLEHEQLLSFLNLLIPTCVGLSCSMNIELLTL